MRHGFHTRAGRELAVGILCCGIGKEHRRCASQRCSQLAAAAREDIFAPPDELVVYTLPHGAIVTQKYPWQTRTSMRCVASSRQPREKWTNPFCCGLQDRQKTLLLSFPGAAQCLPCCIAQHLTWTPSFSASHLVPVERAPKLKNQMHWRDGSNLSVRCWGPSAIAARNAWGPFLLGLVHRGNSCFKVLLGEC